MSMPNTTDQPEQLAAVPCSPPFADRQKVDAKRYDASSPPWDRMGICIVIDQRKTRGCESGWMVKSMSKDGTVKELDSHWLSAANVKDHATDGARDEKKQPTTN